MVKPGRPLDFLLCLGGRARDGPPPPGLLPLQRDQQQPPAGAEKPPRALAESLAWLFGERSGQVDMQLVRQRVAL
jgi:hypothetical protein